MQRFARVVPLLPEAEAEYVRLHEAVWPSVLRTIAQCGIANYSIFVRNGMVFEYFEYHGSDYAADMQTLAADPDMQRWRAITDPLQAPSSGAALSVKGSSMREVFHFHPLPEVD